MQIRAFLRKAKETYCVRGMAELSPSARVRYHFSSKQEEAVLRKLHLESSFRAEGRGGRRRLPVLELSL